MKRLSNWDTYVREATKNDDRSIEIPLTQDETYVVGYPTRRQGRAIAKAQSNGDTDALLVAMLGKEVGTRVKQLAEDQPAYVLDEFLIDVMKKFGMIPDDDELDTKDDDEAVGDDSEDRDGDPVATVTPVNGRRNGRPAKGKAVAARKSSGASRR